MPVEYTNHRGAEAIARWASLQRYPVVRINVAGLSGESLLHGLRRDLCVPDAVAGVGAELSAEWTAITDAVSDPAWLREHAGVAVIVDWAGRLKSADAEALVAALEVVAEVMRRRGHIARMALVTR